MRGPLPALAATAFALTAANAVFAGETPAPPQSGPQGWIIGVDSWQRLEGSNVVAPIKQRTTGVYGGAEFDAGAGWRVGGALGASRSWIRIDAFDSKADIDSYSAGLYAKRSFIANAGKVNLLAAASYVWHDIDTTRHFNLPGISQTLTADVSGNTVLTFAELGYELPLSERVGIEPFAGVAFRDVRTRGFSESGGSAALSAESGRVVQTTSTLGLRGQTSVTLGPAVGRVRALLGWRRAFGDIEPGTTLALDGGGALTVAGAPIARAATLAGLGLEMALSRSMAVELAYGGQFASGIQEHTGSLSLRWAFDLL